MATHRERRERWYAESRERAAAVRRAAKKLRWQAAMRRQEERMSKAGQRSEMQRHCDEFHRNPHAVAECVAEYKARKNAAASLVSVTTWADVEARYRREAGALEEDARCSGCYRGIATEGLRCADCVRKQRLERIQIAALRAQAVR